MGQIGAKCFKLCNNISKIVICNAQANDSNFQKVAYGGSHKQAATPRLSLKKPSHLKTHVANPMLLTPI